MLVWGLALEQIAATVPVVVIVGVTVQGRSAKNIEPHRSLSVPAHSPFPVPVAPAVVLTPHAIEAALSRSALKGTSKISVNVAGLVAVHASIFSSSPSIPIITTAAFATVVVMEDGAKSSVLPVVIVPGATSNGPPATPPVTATPENAAIPPDMSSAAAFPANVKLEAATSSAVATLYKIVPHQLLSLLVPNSRPVTNVQPALVAFARLSLSLSVCTIFANIKSPIAKAVGLLIVSVALVLVLVCEPLRKPICAEPLVVYNSPVKNSIRVKTPFRVSLISFSNLVKFFMLI